MLRRSKNMFLSCRYYTFNHPIQTESRKGWRLWLMDLNYWCKRAPIQHKYPDLRGNWDKVHSRGVGGVKTFGKSQSCDSVVYLHCHVYSPNTHLKCNQQCVRWWEESNWTNRQASVETSRSDNGGQMRNGDVPSWHVLDLPGKESSANLRHEQKRCLETNRLVC